jgi:hypothetical protein
MSFDYTRIRRGEMIAAIGAIALFILMFLPWYSFNGDARTRFLLNAGGKAPLTGNAWHVYSNTSLILIALVLVALALPVLTAMQQRISFPLAAATAGLGLLVAALVADKLFIHRPGGNTYSDVAYGGYLGLVAVLAIILGASLTAREDGVTWGDTDRAPSTAEGGDPTSGSARPIDDPAPTREAPPRDE